MPSGEAMTIEAIDYEAEFDSTRTVPGFAAILEGWAPEAAAFRSTARADLGIAYGPAPRNRLDLFLPEGEPRRAVAMFIHGGFWMSFDGSHFSHMARGLVAHGVPVAVPTYSLCPDVSLGAIIDEIRAATAYLWRRFRLPVIVTGHSAGGHLAACMAATDWGSVDTTLPPRLVPAAYSLSGVFDLEPLLGIEVNRALRMSPEEARAWSPIRWTPPAGAVLVAAVGGDETGEHRRQCRAMADVWTERGAAASYEEIPSRNHFDVIAPLADPHSAMVRSVLELAGPGPWR
jgi:arylformamidase